MSSFRIKHYVPNKYVGHKLASSSYNSHPRAANPRNSSSPCGGLLVAISRDNILNMN